MRFEYSISHKQYLSQYILQEFLLLPLHLFDLVSNESGCFKLSVFDSDLKLFSEFIEDDRLFGFGEFFEFFSGSSLECGEILRKSIVGFYRLDCFDIGYRDRWIYVMNLIMIYLKRSSTIGLKKCFGHAFCHGISIQDHLATRVTGCTSDNLYQRGGRSQKSLLVGIKYGYETHLR